MTRPKLLVVDDDPSMVRLVAKAATMAGFEVLSSSEPERFEDLYRDDFEVIILDLSMPRVDGIQLLRYLAAADCRADVLLMSGFDNPVLTAAAQFATARGLSVLGSLPKPFHLKTLVSLLRGRAVRTGAVPGAMKVAPAPPPPPGEDELREAITGGDLVPYFQPKVSLATGALSSLEALSRWRHQSRGLIPPGLFIPLAEECGLIDDLTFALLERVLEQSAQWLDHGLRIPVAFNLSARSLTEIDLPERIVSRIEHHRLDVSLFAVEITESSVARDDSAMLDILMRLRLKGLGLAIDDFGTGFSNLEQLRKIPFTEIKIDRGFVKDAERSPGSLAIVESTVGLGHRLGLRVVAEGIENEAQWSLLAELGCDEGQGYFIGRPMEGAEVPGWAESWARRSSSL